MEDGANANNANEIAPVLSPFLHSRSEFRTCDPPCPFLRRMDPIENWKCQHSGEEEEEERHCVSGVPLNGRCKSGAHKCTGAAVELDK